MTSKSSFSNLRLLSETLRRYIWAIALSFIGFFFAQVVPVAMTMQQYAESASNPETDAAYLLSFPQTLSRLLSYDNPAVKLGMIAAAVVGGLVLFRYLHSRQQIDFYHSLPIRRGQLFSCNFITGLIVVIPPYLLMLAISGGIVCAAGHSELFFTMGTLSGAAVNLTFFLLIYAVTVLCTILSGNTGIALLLDGLALFSGSSLPYLWVQCKSIFFQTYSTGNDILGQTLCTRLSPIIQYMALSTDTRELAYASFYTRYSSALSIYRLSEVSLSLLTVCYLAAAVLVAALSYVLFCRRKSESAGSAIAFRRFQLPLKLWCMVNASLWAGVLLFSHDASSLWMYFGLAAGLVLSAAVLEILFAFDARAVLRRWKSAAVCAVLVAVAIGCLKMDIAHYDEYIPEAGDITAVDIDLQGYERNPGTSDLGVPYWAEAEHRALFSDPQNIERALTLAQDGVDSLGYWDRPAADRSQEEYAPMLAVNITYQMQSGGYKERTYEMPTTAANAALLRDVWLSEEYRTKCMPPFSFTMTGDDRLTVYNGVARDYVAQTTRPEEIQAITEAMKKDLLQRTEAQLRTEKPVLSVRLASVGKDDVMGDLERDTSGNLIYRNDSELMPVYATDTETLALIQRYLQAVPLSIPDGYCVSANLTYYLSDGGPSDYAPSAQQLTITDPADLAALVSKAIPNDLYWATSAWLGISERLSDGRKFEVTLMRRDGSELRAYYLPGDEPNAVFEQYFSDLMKS